MPQFGDGYDGVIRVTFIFLLPCDHFCIQVVQLGNELGPGMFNLHLCPTPVTHLLTQAGNLQQPLHPLYQVGHESGLHQQSTLTINHN